jgi:protease-4
MKQETNRKPIGLIIFILIILFLLSMIAASFISLSADLDVSSLSGNTALIPVKGVISVDSGGWGEEGASSEEIVEFIEKADKNPNVKAIILDINSPGGSAVASEEVASAVKKTNKTTVAFIREVGASGGYWIASASDYIVANRMSVTGSIGVISSYLEVGGFLSDHNITYQRLVAGKYKDMGSPLRTLTTQEKDILQNKLDKIQLFFIEEVAENRGLTEEQIKKVSTAEFYLGSEAKELGLVDELGGKQQAIDYIEEKINATAQIARYEKRRTLFGALTEVMNQGSFNIGKGIGSSIFAEQNPLKAWT